jgi:hypothetical protein
MKLKTLKNAMLNWYKFDILFSIELLDIFINNVESQIKTSIQNFIDQKETLILNEQPEIFSARIVDVYDGLDSESWDLERVFKEHFPNLQRKSALISLYSFLEFELYNLCVLFKTKEDYKIDLKDIKGRGIEKSVLYLKKAADVHLDISDNNWNELINIQKIRNLIVHNNSNLTSLDGKLKEDELKYINRNEFLTGESEIIIDYGFLTHVLTSFNNLFKQIDNLIQKKYKKIA